MQGEFEFGRQWGGVREGAGRKKKKGRDVGVGHGRRPKVSRHDPLLITWKCRRGLGSLRREVEAWVIVRAIRDSRREGFRLVHFSIQRDHLHLIVEADGREELVRGMKGLGCRIARGLNRVWGRKGAVFAGRFHERRLRSLVQVRNALRYVLNNHRKHGVPAPAGRPDPFSSGQYFNGWSDYPQQFDHGQQGSYLSPPGWKLAVGWRQRCPGIPVECRPGAKPLEPVNNTMQLTAPAALSPA